MHYQAFSQDSTTLQMRRTHLFIQSSNDAGWTRAEVGEAEGLEEATE